MPQKRNPDVFELLRAAAATIEGALVETLSLTAKLTSGYHRDLQRLKAPLFRSIDLAGDVLTITAHALPEIRFRREQIRMPDFTNLNLVPIIFLPVFISTAFKPGSLVLKRNYC